MAQAKVMPTPSSPYEAMCSRIGETWARKTVPYQPSATITDVVQTDAVGAWGWYVVFDEGAFRGQKVDGFNFLKSYHPVSTTASAAVPKAITQALIHYETASSIAHRAIAGTAQYHHLLAEQSRAKEALIRAIVEALTNARGI